MNLFLMDELRLQNDSYQTKSMKFLKFSRRNVNLRDAFGLYCDRYTIINLLFRFFCILQFQFF